MNPIDDYIQKQAPDIQPLLNYVRNRLSETLPEALETISWNMPTWKAQKNLIHFAAHKKHLGIYPGSRAIEHFVAVFEQEDYKYSKGAVQFPYNRPIPLDLIRDIALWNQANL